MNATTYGLDIAKSVFQLYWVDPESGEIFNRRFGRDQFIRFLSNREPGRVALEACSGAHWWARKIASLGHQAILLHAKYVRPFVQTNKTDAADARAIWIAAQQPGMRTVAIKSEAQQAILSLHRIRSALVDTRTTGPCSYKDVNAFEVLPTAAKVHASFPLLAEELLLRRVVSTQTTVFSQLKEIRPAVAVMGCIADGAGMHALCWPQLGKARTTPRSAFRRASNTDLAGIGSLL